MERSILQTLHFDINIPIAYRFLRRFAKVSGGRWAWGGGKVGERSVCGHQKLPFASWLSAPSLPFTRGCSSQCARATMETLTLARFICELTLQDYAFVQEGASRLAASCLLLALKMKNLGGWVRIPHLDLWASGKVCAGRRKRAEPCPAQGKGAAFPLWWQRWAGDSWGEEAESKDQGHNWAGEKGEHFLGPVPLLLTAQVTCQLHTCA